MPHLLLGVVDVLAEAGSAQPFAAVGIDIERFRAQVLLRVHGSEAADSTMPLPYSATVLTALASAQQAAGPEVDLVHLLRAAITTDPATTAITELALRAADGEFDEFLASLDVTLACGTDAGDYVLEPAQRRPDLEIAFHPDLTGAQIATAVRALGDLTRDCGGCGLELRFEVQDCVAPAPDVVGRALRDVWRALSAQIFAVTRRDWRTRPGRNFKRLLRTASSLAERYGLAERVDDARKLLRKRIEGAAVGAYEKAALDAAMAEEARTRSRVAQRTAEAAIERSALENESNRADARRSETEALACFMETTVRCGLAVSLRGARIDIVPHGGVIVVEDVRTVLDGEQDPATSRD